MKHELETIRIENIYSLTISKDFSTFSTKIEQNLHRLEPDTSKIKMVSPKEVASEILHNFNLKKSLGYELITGKILK